MIFFTINSTILTTAGSQTHQAVVPRMPSKTSFIEGAYNRDFNPPIKKEARHVQ